MGFVAEARLEESGSGLAPVTEGWFVVNVRDAEWFSSETRGAACWFENEYGDPPVEFAQLGINVTVLEPGQSGVYHAESNQEAFLVLAGECRLLVEGEERRLRALGLLPLSPLDGARLRGCWRQAVRDPDGRCTLGPGRAVPGVGARGALRRERGEGDIRSGAGLCGGRAVPARAAAVLVAPALGLGLQGNIPAPPGMRRRRVHVTFPHAGPGKCHDPSGWAQAKTRCEVMSDLPPWVGGWCRSVLGAEPVEALFRGAISPR